MRSLTITVLSVWHVKLPNSGTRRRKNVRCARLGFFTTASVKHVRSAQKANLWKWKELAWLVLKVVISTMTKKCALFVLETVTLMLRKANVLIFPSAQWVQPSTIPSNSVFVQRTSLMMMDSDVWYARIPVSGIKLRKSVNFAQVSLFTTNWQRIVRNAQLRSHLRKMESVFLVLNKVTSTPIPSSVLSALQTLSSMKPHKHAFLLQKLFPVLTTKFKTPKNYSAFALLQSLLILDLNVLNARSHHSGIQLQQNVWVVKMDWCTIKLKKYASHAQ